MASVGVTVDARAFKAGFATAIKELRLDVAAIVERTGEKAAEQARILAPKRTRALAESIHVTPLEQHRLGPFLKVVAGTREALPMEFGTYKDRPQPFMRPAAALAAGGLRSAGYAARVTSDKRSRLFVRRLKARAVVRHHRAHGLLSAREARLVSEQLSNQLRFRRPRKAVWRRL